MSLNDYRDEAGDFLTKINAKNNSEDKIGMLEEEFGLLKGAVDTPERLRHQIYDMMFLLFEIASVHGFDLDEEWDKGRKRKQEKYLSKS